MISFAQTSTPSPILSQDWQVCNETSYILNVAIASIRDDDNSGQLSVKDWQKLRAGKCLAAIVKKNAPRYVYARSHPLHQGNIHEWKGQYTFCISPDTIKAVDKPVFSLQAEQKCSLQNLLTADFLRVIPSEKRTAFVEPNNYGKKAETAGLQRLLLDNNYNIKRIDGIGGRRTSNTLKAFLKDQKLKPGLSLDAKLDALETGAIAAKPNVGVHLCNANKKRIWGALAWRSNAHWESQGWWPIEPGSCANPFTRSLKNADVFLYARLETETTQDMVLKPISTNYKAKTEEREFCVGSSSFAAVSHDYCRDQGYIRAKFRPLPNDKTGVKLTFDDQDFIKPTLNNLR